MSQQQPRFPDPHLSNYPPHPPTSQFPPSQGGYHWICDFCNSVMGTREQTERHQFHCPARASTQQAAPFRPHPGVPATHGYQGGYDGRSQQPLPPRPPHTYPTGMRSHRPQQHDPTVSQGANVQHQVPDSILRHPPISQMHPLASTSAAVDIGRAKRETVLIWVKETSTLEREVNYIDNVDGGMVLRWSQEFECFRCEGELSLGQHSGVLSLGIRDSILPIRPFIVEAGGPTPQNILISFEQNQKLELPPQTQRRNVTQSDFLRAGASATPREPNSHDRIQELETMLSKLNVNLEARSSELAKQKEMENRIKQVLNKTEEENMNLSREVDELKRNNSFLRESLKEAEKVAKRAGQEPGFQVEGDDSELQECQSERERLYAENEKLKKEKRIANDYSDRLRSQKQSLEVELKEVQESLDSTQREKEELSHKLQLLSKEEAATPPPVPIRSRPLPKDVQVPKHPPEGEKYSPELGLDLNSGLKRVSYEGKELRLRPLANLVEAEQHKGHRVVCECEGASQTTRYLEGVLMCLFEDGNTRIAGVQFSTKVLGSSDGVYKGKEWFGSPEGMGGFFPDESVYIST